MCECDLYFYVILIFVWLSLNNGRIIVLVIIVIDVGDCEFCWWFCISILLNICDIKISFFIFLFFKIVFLLLKFLNYLSKVIYLELEIYCMIKFIIVL